MISDQPDSISDEKRKLIELYCEGISKYRNREWKAAAEIFEKELSIDPSDYPSTMYLERSRMFELQPPPANWNGVFVMETK